MSRIAPASPPYPESIQSGLSKLVPAGMTPIWLFRVLARDERLFARSIGKSLLDRGHVSLRDRELIILRVCANNRSEYEWGVHVAVFSKKAGLSDEQVRATTEPGVDVACWSMHERRLLALCDELQASTEVSDALWQALSAEHSPEALLELLLLIGFYRTISILTNSLRMPLESFAARFPALAQPAASEPSRHLGSCLCGAVGYEIDGELGEFGYCHCRSCRKASGSAHAANAPVPRARFRLTRGEAELRDYESSPGKHRAFCGRCGAPIYAYLDASPELLRIRLGSLDTDFGKQPRAHTFVAEKARWEPITDELPQFPSWAPKSVLDQRGSRQPQR